MNAIKNPTPLVIEDYLKSNGWEVACIANDVGIGEERWSHDESDKPWCTWYEAAVIQMVTDLNH